MRTLSIVYQSGRPLAQCTVTRLRTGYMQTGYMQTMDMNMSHTYCQLLSFRLGAPVACVAVRVCTQLGRLSAERLQ